MRIGLSLPHVLVALTAIASSTLGCALDGDDASQEEEGSASTTSESELGATTKKTIEYFVQAHPDDEFASWSLVQRSRDRYPVFIMLTQGEETSYCTPAGRAGNERDLGEAAPPANAYEGKWTRGCREARVQSWHRFLDAMADYDPSLSKPRYRGTFSGDGTAGGLAPTRDDDGRTSESRSFKVYADERSARVVFDLGDGDLTPEEVTWAIQSVRARRRTLFPRIAENSVVAASYRNVDPRCAFYDHHDHRSVHVAIHGTNQGTPGPQLGSTCIHDRDVANGGRVAFVDEDVFEHAMGVDAPVIDPTRYPSAKRTGVFQIHYGWLIEGYWPAHGAPNETIVSRQQAFWSRF